MKLLLRLFVFCLALVLILGLVAAFLPASTALGLVQDRMREVRMEGVSGSVWNGRADALTVRERALGAFTWKLSPWALFSKRVDVDITLDGPDLKAAGFVSLSGPGSLQLRGMQASVDAQRLQGVLDVPALVFKGRVEFDLRELVVDQYFPAKVEGSAVWRDAMVGGSADARLGDIRADFATQGVGTIAGTVTDSGGPLMIEGGTFSAGVQGVSAEATLRARDGDAAVLRALQYIGQPQEDGSSRLEVRGQLNRVGG
jgi:general secretion pathway protein N